MFSSLDPLLMVVNDPLFLVGAYIVLTLAGLGIVIFLLFKWLSKKRTGEDQVLSGNIKTQIVSLSISAILFPATFVSLINAILSFFYAVFVRVPVQLTEKWTGSLLVVCRPDSDISECVSLIWGAFIEAWSSAFSYSLTKFSVDNISYSKFIVMLALWVILSQFLIPYFTKYPSTADEEKNNLLRIVFHKLRRNKNDVLFYSILFIGIYLSIAAIVAIPYMEITEEPSDDYSVQQLENSLTAAYSITEKNVPESVSLNNPYSDLQNYLNEGHSFIMPEVLTEVNLRKNNFDQALSLYDQLYQALMPRLPSLITTGTNNFRVDSGSHIGEKETRKHFLLIESWYRSILSGQEWQLNTCRNQIEALYDTEKYWADSTLLRMQTVQDKESTEVFQQTVSVMLASVSPTIMPGPLMTETVCDTGTPTPIPTRSATVTQVAGTATYTVKPAGLSNFTATPTLTNTPIPTLTYTFTPKPSFTCTRTETPTITETFTQTATIPTKTLISKNDLLISENAQTYAELLDNINMACETDAIDKKIINLPGVPSRPTLGGNMGPFKYVASWLMDTESLPLAQIVGMLGFGFLGSAVAGKVRCKKPKKLTNETQPTVSQENEKNPSSSTLSLPAPEAKKTRGSRSSKADSTPANLSPASQEKPDECKKEFSLVDVILYGSSAALVVFLSVKGGLTILNAGDNEPNSYMLFLLCLIAAVFSEEVWYRVEKYLGKLLDERISDKPDK